MTLTYMLIILLLVILLLGLVYDLGPEVKAYSRADEGPKFHYVFSARKWVMFTLVWMVLIAIGLLG